MMKMRHEAPPIAKVDAKHSVDYAGTQYAKTIICFNDVIAYGVIEAMRQP